MVEDVTLKRQLQALCCNPKARVLLKSQKGKILPNLKILLSKQSLEKIEFTLLFLGKDISEDEIFTWNGKFSYKLFKLKINQVQIKETVEENKETNEQIFQDRQLQGNILFYSSEVSKLFSCQVYTRSFIFVAT